jgi:hypothetical protein
MPNYWKSLFGMSARELRSEIVRSRPQNRNASVVAKRKLLAKFLIGEKHLSYPGAARLLHRDRSATHHLYDTCPERWTGGMRRK